MIVPVILAGGSGSRLWPLSRSAYPKQLLPLVSHLTMLQETVLRTHVMKSAAPPLIVCNQEHRFLVEEQIRDIGIDDAIILLEPFGKNTAPAVAIAAFFLKEYCEQDCSLMIMPADHVIGDQASLLEAISQAEISAKANKLVTFGVKPTHAETGYGYIKTNGMEDEKQVYPVLEFVEKPNAVMAKHYFLSKQYFWNSGMFLFQGSFFLQELKEHAPLVWECCKKTAAAMTKDLGFYRLDKNIFSECPAISIDYAVMEKTKHAMLVPLHSEWSDVGSWSALWETQKTDTEGNVVSGDVIIEQSKGSYLRAESRMLAVLGVNDHIVIETPDAVLVAHKDHSQNVRNIVTQLKKNKRPEIDLHRKVYRPWGHYETIDESHCFLVKRITVKPGARLSLQTHRYRSEHWVVVSGVAEVTRHEEVFIIQANESTYIPKGVKHRLSNPGTDNLEIIEVQSGSYLGEDDIVRFDDVYGRMETTSTI